MKKENVFVVSSCKKAITKLLDEKNFTSPFSHLRFLGIWPLAIDVRVQPDTVHWFLDDDDDVRSSLFLEDAASEFDIQGLELDWSCVVWDGDFRYTPRGWANYSFLGSRWTNINKEERKLYQKNAYRVLLTRARQGMIIVVPEGNKEDATRKLEFYDSTFNYLKSLGLKVI
jgi:hypothetical protein